MRVGGQLAGAEVLEWSSQAFAFPFYFAVGGVGLVLHVFFGWRHALRSGWPFIICIGVDEPHPTPMRPFPCLHGQLRVQPSVDVDLGQLLQLLLLRSRALRLLHPLLAMCVGEGQGIE